MFVGIDVSKNTLDAALLREEGKPRHKVFANSAPGHCQLLAWLSDNGAATLHVCLEATGTWADTVALALHEAGHQVSVVNPALIRAFGQSQLKRTKTDKAGCPQGGPFSSRAFARCTSHRSGSRRHPKSENSKPWCAAWKAAKRCGSWKRTAWPQA
jgi:transposase